MTTRAAASLPSYPIVATNPQLLIHNGGYHYREYACVNSGCLSSPWSLNWDVNGNQTNSSKMTPSSSVADPHVRQVTR